MEKFLKNKKVLLDLIYIIVYSFILQMIYQFEKSDYINVKYLFPYINFYRLISISLIWFWTLIYFDMIQNYINIKSQILIRVNKRKYNFMMNIKMLKFIFIFLLTNTMLDLFFFHKIFYIEVVSNIIPFCFAFLIVNYFSLNVKETSFQFILLIIFIITFKILLNFIYLSI